MPNQQIVFPANFATASAMAFTNPDGSIELVSEASALPVSGALTSTELHAAPIMVTGALTNSQLRATPLAVTGLLSNSELRASAIAVTGPVTDAELRAAPIPVSGGLSNAELRAGPVFISASDGTIATIGAMGDNAATSDGGTFSLTALTKRLLGKFAIGQKPMTQSLAVTMASDQTNLEPGGAAITAATMPAGGTGLTGWLSAVYAVCAAPTPTGTNHIGGVSVDDVIDAATMAGSVTSAITAVAAGTAGFAGGSFQVISAGTTCTISYEQSNDNTNWAALPVISLASASAAPVLTTTAVGIYGFIAPAAFVRARVSTYGSGTVTVQLTQKRIVQNVTGTSLAAGSAAIGSVTVSGTVNPGIGFTDSITALAASATFTGTGRNTALNQYAFFNASAFANVAGTIWVDQSLDSGTSYQAVISQAVAANATGQIAVRITGAPGTATLYRVRYVNGAGAQTTFRLASSFSAS